MSAWLSGLIGTAIGGLVSLITTWINTGSQRRLEADRAAAALKLEAMKAHFGSLAKATERRATVAADVLLAGLDLLDAMKTATSVAVLTSDPDEQPGEEYKLRLGRTVAARWGGVEKYHRRFLKRYALAEVYLPDPVCDALDRIRQMKWSIQVDQQTHVDLGDDSVNHPFFKQGFGAEPAKKIDALRNELKSLLRPLSQLAAAPGDAPPAP